MSDGMTVYIDGPKRWSVEVHNQDKVGNGRFSIHEHIGADYTGAITNDVTLARDAYLIAAAPILKAALEAVAVPVIGASGPRLCWCPDDWEMRPSGHSEPCKTAQAALAAATPPIAPPAAEARGSSPRAAGGAGHTADVAGAGGASLSAAGGHDAD